MFYYTDQPHTPFFLTGLIKTEFGIIVRLVETGLGRWTLVVAVVTVDVYPFLAFSDLSFHLDDTVIDHDSAMSRMEVCPYSYYWWCRFFRGSWVSICYDRWVLSEVHGDFFKHCRLMNSQDLKPNNFESQNSLTLNFTNIQSLRWNIVDCESFLELSPLDILLYVGQTWMTQLILALFLCGVVFL